MFSNIPVSPDDSSVEFRYLLPEEQIQPACEEAYAGVLSIIAHAHDKTFPYAAGSGPAVVGSVLLTKRGPGVRQGNCQR